MDDDNCWHGEHRRAGGRGGGCESGESRIKLNNNNIKKIYSKGEKITKWKIQYVIEKSRAKHDLLKALMLLDGEWVFQYHKVGGMKLSKERMLAWEQAQSFSVIFRMPVEQHSP